MNDSFPKIKNIKKIYDDIYFSFDIITIYEKLDKTFLICTVKSSLCIYDFLKEEETIELINIIAIDQFINSILNYETDYFFIITPNIIFLYKFQNDSNEFLVEITKLKIDNLKFEFLDIFELNNNHFLLLHNNGCMIVQYLKNENKLQIKSNYTVKNENICTTYAFGLNSKKLKFKNIINDFIFFQYNICSFINYQTIKTKKELTNTLCNLPLEYNPKYYIIDSSKNLVGFNSKNYYFFIVDLYHREIPFKFILCGSLYYSIYTMEQLAYNKYICFYQEKGCYSSHYIASFCSIFSDNTFGEMFEFKNEIDIPDERMLCSTINSDKTYVFCQPYKKVGLYLIHLNYE